MPRSDATRSRPVGTQAATVAVPEWQGRVSPVFDVAGTLLLVQPEKDGQEGSRRTESLGSASAHERARRLRELGVDVLVCGAISRPLEALVAAEGVRVVANICGPTDEVAAAFRDGTLDDGRFAMPGCCRRRQRGPNRCRRGRGP